MKDNGNVVLAYTSDCVLMLDTDLKRKDEVKGFAKEYTMFHDLGSTLVMKTSESGQVDLFGEPLANFCVIFGKVLSWEEIRWHVQEAYRLGMVNRAFTALRQFGSITIRVNDKNNKIPYPKIVYYFRNGDRKGVMGFLRHWVMCKKLGQSSKDKIFQKRSDKYGKEERWNKR